MSETFRALLEINKKINPAAPTDALLTAIAEEAARLLEVDNAGFRLVDGDELVVAGLAGTARETMTRQRIGLRESLSGQVATEGRAIITDLEGASDVLIAEHLAADRRLGYTGYLGVPLRAGDRIIGVLSFRARRRFAARDAEVAEAFAGQAALALEQARLYRDTQRQAERMAALAAVERLVAATLDADVVAQRIVDSVCDLVGARSAALYRLDVAAERLVALTVAQNSGFTFEWARAMPAEQGIAGQAIRERRAVWSSDTLTNRQIVYSPEVIARIKGSTDRGLLAVPLVVRDRVIGALAIGDHTGRRFTDDDVRLAAAFADQAAIALENARLFSLETARRAQSEALAEVEREMAAELDPDRLLAVIVQQAGRLFAADCTIHLARGQRLTVVASSGGVDGGDGLDLGEGLIGTAAQARQGFLVNDYPQSPHALERYVTRGVRRSMGMPLVLRDRLLGVIGVFRSGEEAPIFTPDDRGVLESFATQAAIALENARLHGESERRRRTAEHLADLGRLLSQSLDPEEVGQRIVESVRTLFGVMRCALYGAPPGAEELVVLGFSNDPSLGQAFGQDLTFRRGIGAVGLAVSERRLVMTSDLTNAPEIPLTLEVRERFEASPIRALLAVPLIVGDAVIGVLATGDRAGRIFDDEELRTLGAFADQAAVALENARLYRRAREYGARLLALEEVNRVVSSSLQMDEVLQNIATAVAQFFDASYLAVWVFDPSTRRARRVLAHGDPAFSRGLRDELALGESLVGWALEHREPILWTDVERDPRVVQPSRMIDHGMRYFTVYPIAIGDRLLGAFSMSRVTPPVAAPETQSLLGSLAAQAALALDHARLFAETRRRLDETRALLEVVEILNSTLDSRQLLRQVAMKIAQVCRVDRCSFSRLDGEHVIPVMSQFADGRRDPALWQAWARTAPDPIGHVPAQAQLVATRRPVIIDVAAESDLVPRHWVESYHVKSCLLVPLLRQDGVMGMLNLDCHQQVTPFAPWQVDLAMAIAGQLALALENADLSRQTQAKLRETEALLSVSRAVSSTLDLTTLFRHFLRPVASILGADSAGIWLLGEDGEWMEAHVGYHLPRDLVDALRRVRISIVKDEFFAEAARTQRAVFSRDVDADPRVPAMFRESVPHRSHLFVPIVTHGRFIGGFSAVWWERERELAPGDVDLMEAIANQAAIAIANVRLFEENRRQVEELSTLYELSRAVTGQLDRAALIDAVATQTARVLDARDMIALLVDEDRRDFEVVFRIDDGVRQPEHERYPLHGVGLQSVVLNTGRPLRCDDYVAECARHGVQPVARSTPQPFWLGVPMRVGDETLGVVALRSAERAFTASDERLLANIGQVAALALRSARLFDERTRAYGELAAAQDQLVRTEKLRALGEMASGVAHDFNNLLAAILGRAQLLQRHVQDAKLVGWLQVIERSAIDGAQTVRRLQEFARVRRDEPFGPVDLNQVIRDAVEMTQSRWREDALRQGVVIDVRTSTAPLATVAGDAAELREVMTNLILNAVDAMPRGGTLSVSSTVAGDSVELAVNDTGVGIPPALRERIFDPFFTTKGPQGTGLGLSMTYGILSRHGARITVDSEEGRGSTFRITFVRAELHATAAPAAGEPLVSTEILRCLVVDDESAVATVLGDVLEASGHHVVVLTDGAEAIARLKQESFDVVFTDLAMPRVSGWDVAHAVQASAPGIPVFLVTGFGVELSAAERRAHGVAEIFSKPLRIDDITRAVAQVGRHSGPRRAPEAKG